MSIRLFAWQSQGLALMLAAASALMSQTPAPPETAAADDSPTVTFGTTTYLPTGLRGAVYAIRENTTFLPDFEKLKPLGYVYTNRINIPTRQFSEGFPGISGQAEWFAIDYRGRFWIKNPGKYNFILTSDDGSQLFIDDKLLIDNDGIHAARPMTGAVNLSARLHTIRLTYFQGPKYELALILAVSPPGGKAHIFNTADYVPGEEQLTEVEAKEVADMDRDDLRRRQMLDTSSPDEKAAVQLLSEPTRPHAFEFRTAVFGFRNDGTSNQNVLAFELPVASLRETPNPAAKTHKLSFFALAAVKDTQGEIVKKFSLDSPYQIPDDKFTSFRTSSFTFTRPFTLPPGAFTLETAVFDREGKTVSVSSVPIDRTGPAGGPGLSTPVLVQRVQTVQGQADPLDFLVVEGKRLTPQLARELPVDAKPKVYFVIYPDKSNTAPPTVTITFLVDGKQLAQQSSDLPQPDAAGAIPVTIAAAIQPGNCELRITAVQGAASTSKSVTYSIAGSH